MARKPCKYKALQILRNLKKGLAHRFLMCYLIGDEGSACPTSCSKNKSTDRTALLFLLLKFD